MPELTDNELWMQGDEFGGVDFRHTPEEPVDNSRETIAPDLNPELITNVPALQSELEPEIPVQTVAEPEPEVPLIFTNEDGSYTRMERYSKGGWKATVDIGTGTTQDYYGKTKDELIQNILKAQLHATKKIREQNRTIKLGATVDEAAPTIHKVERKIGRELSADEKVELKLLFETDPAEAINAWFTKTSGRTVSELVAKADAGEKAQRELTMEATHKEFLSSCPGYYPDSKYENYNSLISYLAKHKLRRGRKAGDETEVIEALVDNGFYTASNLEEAFTELSEAGLLLSAPRTPEKPAPPVPAPPAAPERIVRTETRPRAGLGITSREVTPTRTPEPTPPSVEDFNNLSDEQLDELIAAERRKARASRR